MDNKTFTPRGSFSKGAGREVDVSRSIGESTREDRRESRSTLYRHELKQREDLQF